MATKFTDLTTKTTAAATDLVPINDVSSGSDKKVTVGGLASAVAANVPTGGQSTVTLTNPYKFRVHLATGQTVSSNTFTRVAFDTKDFDTSSNVDVVTNKGRFTAPIAGYYQFNATVENVSGTSARNLASLYKNGAEYSRGNDAATSGQATGGAGVSDFMQLASGDYVEIFFLTSGNSIAATNTDGAYATYFSGFLVSTT